MRYTYIVTYNVKTTVVDNCEFSSAQIEKKHSHITETDDLGEIFTDLYHLHREESIIGLEVLSVDAFEESLINKLEYSVV